MIQFILVLIWLHGQVWTIQYDGIEIVDESPSKTLVIDHHYHHHWHYDCHAFNKSCDDCINHAHCYYCLRDRSCHHYHRGSGDWGQRCLQLSDMYLDSCSVSVKALAIIAICILRSVLITTTVCFVLLLLKMNCCKAYRRRHEQQWHEMWDRRQQNMIEE